MINDTSSQQPKQSFVHMKREQEHEQSKVFDHFWSPGDARLAWSAMQVSAWSDSSFRSVGDSSPMTLYGAPSISRVVPGLMSLEVRAETLSGQRPGAQEHVWTCAWNACNFCVQCASLRSTLSPALAAHGHLRPDLHPRALH